MRPAAIACFIVASSLNPSRILLGAPIRTLNERDARQDAFVSCTAQRRGEHGWLSSDAGVLRADAPPHALPTPLSSRS
jgi:hypothetical protein